MRVIRRTTYISICAILSLIMAGCAGNNVAVTAESATDKDMEDAVAIMSETEYSANEAATYPQGDDKNSLQDNKEVTEDVIDQPDTSVTGDDMEGIMKTKYDRHGALHVNNNGKLVDHNGETVTLRGYSTHCINLYGDYINRDFLEYMRDEWKIDVIRLAMYTAEENGYCITSDESRKELMDVIDRGVKTATELGLYVIIDWHILSDNNPHMYEDMAADFWDKISAKYSSYGNIFYEICNEPNSGCSWQDIKTYSDRIIPIIRKNDPYAVILVGTPEWSQRVDEAAADPITTDDNVMYVLHFYADTHRDYLRNIGQGAIDKKLPLFVTEFGTCAADGGGAHNKDEADKWIKMLDDNDISYVMWNISNKDETSAMIMPWCEKVTGGYTDDELREPAKWFRDVLKNASGR